MSETIPEKNKALVLEAFDTLFNKRDYAAAENFWSPNYIQHSAHIEAGRDGVVQFDPERTEYAALPASAHRCRARLFIVHGRFSGHGPPVARIAVDIVRIENGRLAEHWDVLQDEATKAESKSGLPMFGRSLHCLNRQALERGSIIGFGEE